MLHALIIAGGSGKRLWPKSRRQSPKFLLKVKGAKTLLQLAVERAAAIMPLENILIFTNELHAGLIKKALPGFPKRNIISEPVSRNTAPAICLAAAIIQAKDADSIMYVMPADQIIEDKSAIKRVFRLCALVSRLNDIIVTIGIKPIFASTGYGYIETAQSYKSPASEHANDVFKVKRFTEKPDARRAKAFVKTNRYLWNSGIFIARPEIFLKEFKKYCPAAAGITDKIMLEKGLTKIKKAVKLHYKDFPDISIDYAIMEKTGKAMVVRADPGWSDIGSWSAISGFLSHDGSNALGAGHIGLDTADSVIVAEKGHLVATCGIKGLVIVHTPKATLVCRKSDSENVKKLVGLMEKKGLKEYL
ncbi:MAG: sugar phosphate nucleotidyltransferase [Candidatus Omnitrophica bacterium]|nr:sugar phosphate nucleotidyltransferase [Candidatus Omnitrophota bacterium]